MLFALITTVHAAPAPDWLVLQARKALREDRFDRARELAEQAYASPGAHDQEAAWLAGLTWQYQGVPQRALPWFDKADEAQPLGPFTDRIALSRSEAQAATGAFKEALATLRKTRRNRHAFVYGERERYALDERMWKLGRVTERGLENTRPRRLRRQTRKLLATIDGMDPNAATWQQAQARTQLAFLWLDFADEQGTATEDAIERRAIFFANARAQLDPTVDLGHDRWSLAQLHRLGTSFERLGDDVVSTHGSFEALPDEDRQKVENVWVKATRYYDLAEEHAGRVRRDAEARLYGDASDHLEAKVDAL